MLGASQIKKKYIGASLVYESFDPLDYAPKLDLDASDLSSIISAAGSVSQWSDKSGNGNHAIQTLGSDQPLTGISSIHGFNTILLDGINDNLQYDGSIIAGKNYTFFYVHKTESFSNAYILGGLTRTTNQNFSIRYNNNTSILFGQYGNDVTGTVAAMSASDARIISGRLNAAGRQLFCNGVLIGSTVNSTQLSGNSGAAIGRFQSVSGAVYAAQEAGRYIVYDYDLSDAQMSKVHAYLMNKWGIS